jgi:hypothetical protein
LAVRFIAIENKGDAMSDRTEAVHFMRESAKELRRIASLMIFLSPKLLTMARELEVRADQLDNVRDLEPAQ